MYTNSIDTHFPMDDDGKCLTSFGAYITAEFDIYFHAAKQNLSYTSREYLC